MNRRRRGGWPGRSAILACLGTLAPGCGAPAPSVESPEQAAPRVFEVAERLEREQKTRQAFAAYQQLVRQFPDSPEGKKAAARIRRSQQRAAGKAR